MIKTIIFDYGGVIGPDSDEWSDHYQDIVIATKLPKDFIDKTWTKNAQNMLTGKTDLPDFFKELSLDSNENISSEKLLAIYYASTKINNEIVTYIKSLKNKGYKLLILSNETKSGMQNKINKFHLQDIFDTIYCSAEIGMTKRDQKLFKYVL